jgi:hypothetical protein
MLLVSNATEEKLEKAFKKSVIIKKCILKNAKSERDLNPVPGARFCGTTFFPENQVAE